MHPGATGESIPESTRMSAGGRARGSRWGVYQLWSNLVLRGQALPVYNLLILPWPVKDSLYLLCFTVVGGYHSVHLYHQDSPKNSQRKDSLHQYKVFYWMAILYIPLSHGHHCYSTGEGDPVNINTYKRARIGQGKHEMLGTNALLVRSSQTSGRSQGEFPFDLAEAIRSEEHKEKTKAKQSPYLSQFL